MTIPVGDDVVTYDITRADETTPKYELSIRYRAAGRDELARIPLSVKRRQQVTKALVSDRLAGWRESRPHA